MLVLVVDDVQSQRLHLSALLRLQGHEVIAVPDGVAALEALEAHSASMVICDVDMPGMDGMELARQIRRRIFGRYVYILMITARDLPGDLVLGLEAGADDFMSKPVNAQILSVRLRAAGRIINYDRELSAKNERLEEASRCLQADLDAGAAAQRRLLPQATLELCSCTISSRCFPSSTVSGDMFGAFEVEPAGLGLYAADVCGHGVSAALLAVALGHLITPEYFRETVLLSEGKHDLQPVERLSAELNRRFADLGEETYFTLFAGLIDEKRDRLVYSQAGYPSPLLLNSSGAASWVGGGGMPIGLFSDASFTADSVHFGAGDRLIVYSDGVTEAESATGEMFGAPRLADFMLAHLRHDASEAADRLATELRSWAAPSVLIDDISLIIIDRRVSDDPNYTSA